MSNVVKIPRAEATAGFDEFWKHCPKRVGKPLAKAKFEAITGDGLVTRTLDKDSGQYVTIELRATPEELIEGMKRYRKSQIDPQTFQLRDGGKYTCHPATWLNQGRWLDEI